jgi:hypothetical protein
VVCLKVPNASETLNNTIYFNTRPEAWTEHYVEAITSTTTPWCASCSRPTTPMPSRMS